MDKGLGTGGYQVTAKMDTYKMETEQQRSDSRHEEDVDKVGREILEPRLGIHS